MTDAEWAEVRSAMPVPAWLLKLSGRPEAFCHREMLDAVRYLVDNGVKWVALPVDFPYWRAVYDFFRRWRSCDYVRELYERLRRSARERAGRNAEPSAGIIDSQSVDASETVGEDSRGYDGGKSRDGRKRHILTDTEGLLLEVTVTTADVHDSKAAPVLLETFMEQPSCGCCNWCGSTAPTRARRSRRRSPATESGSRSCADPTDNADSSYWPAGGSWSEP